jgi:uncharacterized delta-60 repeat protein
MIYPKNKPINAYIPNFTGEKQSVKVYEYGTGSTSHTFKGLIKLFKNGDIDTGFTIGTGFFGNVYSIELQSDNKILVGGSFIAYSGITTNKIIRLNSDGTRDTGFIIGTGFNDTVNEIKIQSDGKILVGGAFSTYSGVSYNRLIRLNSNGTIDNTFNIGTGFEFGSVRTIELQSDGKILVGGGFTTYSGLSYNGLIRLNQDGTIDTGFTIGSGFAGSIQTLDIQTDGKILCGGAFFQYSGVTRNNIVKLNSDGTIDYTFNIGTGFNNNVNKIVYNYIGGLFTSYNGQSIRSFIQLNSDGSINTLFNPVFYSNNIKDISFDEYGGDYTITYTDGKYVYNINQINNYINNIVYKFDDNQINTVNKKNNDLFIGGGELKYKKPIKTEIYSGVVYKKPNNNIINIDIQPFVKDSFATDNQNKLFEVVWENGTTEIFEVFDVNEDLNYNNKLSLYYTQNFINYEILNDFIKPSTDEIIWNKVYNRKNNKINYITNVGDIINIQYDYYIDKYSAPIFSISSSTITDFYNNDFRYIDNEFLYLIFKYTSVTLNINNRIYKFYFEVIDCNDDETFQLNWKNRKGGYDWIVMNKKSITSKKVTRSTYDFYNQTITNSYVLGGNQESKQYLAQTEYIFELNSDLLNDDDFARINDMIYSPEVYIYGGNIFNGGLSDFKKVVIDTDTFVYKKYKNDQMFNFSIRVKLAEKLNTY